MEQEESLSLRKSRQTLGYEHFDHLYKCVRDLHKARLETKLDDGAIVLNIIRFFPRGNENESRQIIWTANSYRRDIQVIHLKIY